MPRQPSTYGGSIGKADERPISKDLGHLRMLAEFVLPHWKAILCAGIALIAAAIGTLGIGRVIQLLIDQGFVGDGQSLTEVFLVAYIVVAVIAVATFARYFLVMWLGERVVADLRCAIYDRVIELDPAFFEVNRTGEILSRITADTTLIQSVVGAGASIALRNLLLLIGSLIMLIITSAKLSGLIILAVPLIVLPLILFGRRVRRLSRATQDAVATIGAAATESITEVQTVQAFVQEDSEKQHFAVKAEAAFSAAIMQVRARGWLTLAVISAVFGSVVTVLWIGAVDVRAGVMTGGDLGAFVVYALMTAGSVAALSEVYGDLQKASGAAERLSELINARSAVAKPMHPLSLPTNPNGAISLHQVSFHYPQRLEVDALKDFSLEVSPGETIALVGPSGSGKTTIFRLLLRYYDPQRGYISFNGVDLVRADPKVVRGHIGLVSQDPVIFSSNAYENIRYGSPGATDQEVRAAAQAAAASEFLERLPDGFSTPLGERGFVLSGGQKQRIAIARAILRNPALLLLDEATSALDAENERLVQESLETLMLGRTTLVIAHRLATVQKVDRIIVIDNGTVVAQGTHDELLRQGGLYTRLAKLQFQTSNFPELVIHR